MRTEAELTDLLVTVDGRDWGPCTLHRQGNFISIHYDERIPQSAVVHFQLKLTTAELVVKVKVGLPEGKVEAVLTHIDDHSVHLCL